MTDLTALLNEAERESQIEEARRIAQRNERIATARMLIHLSLPEDIWAIFGITQATERARISNSDFVDKAGYIIEGKLDFTKCSVKIDFEVQIGNDYFPDLFHVYVSTNYRIHELPSKGLRTLQSKKLEITRHLEYTNESVQEKNRKSILQLLKEIKDIIEKEGLL